MKKVLLTLLCAGFAASLSAQKKVISETTVSTTDLSVTVSHNLYNADGDRILHLVEGVSQNVYSYNALHQVEREEYTVFANSNQSRNYVYTYNAEGLVASREELAGQRSLSTTTYTYDEHGNVTSTTNSVASLSIPQNNTYDAEGRLVKTAVIHPFAGVVMQETVYTYDAAGRLIKEEFSSQGVLSSTTEYAYNEEGLAVSRITTAADGSVTETTIQYADIDVFYQPTAVTATPNADNTVTLSWTGPATGIVYDGQYIEVEGQAYTTPVLVDGTYTFYVSNQGNSVKLEEITVIDRTKVGVTDVQLDGEIKVQTVVSLDENSNEVRATTYYIPVKWTLAEDAKPQSFRIYYNSYYYVDVDDVSLRRFVIPATNISIWSGGVVTLPFEITVQAVYATGVAEPDAPLVLDTEAILALEPEVVYDETSGVNSIVSSPALPDGTYTLSGVRVAPNRLRPGTYIVRKGGIVRKVNVK